MGLVAENVYDKDHVRQMMVLVIITMHRLTLGCRKYTRGSYQSCARAKPERY